MSIGQVIKVVREERGLTQSQFAHELFVTQQALSRWEKGTAEPSIDMIRLISTRFEGERSFGSGAYPDGRCH